MVGSAVVEIPKPRCKLIRDATHASSSVFELANSNTSVGFGGALTNAAPLVDVHNVSQ